MKALNLKGKVFGELLAISPTHIGTKRCWVCLCSCGRKTVVPTSQLNSGNNKTCGAALHKYSIEIGDKFSKLTIKSIYRDSKNRRYMAECVCDCGNVKQASFKNLQRGSTKHCGCDKTYENFGLPHGIAAKRRLILRYISNAKSRKLEFNLSSKECENLFKGNCYLCGTPPSGVIKAKGNRGSYVYSGIDRIDSNKGYTLENTKSCCAECNYLKSNKTNEVFLAHIERIWKHQQSTKTCKNCEG